MSETSIDSGLRFHLEAVLGLAPDAPAVETKAGSVTWGALARVGDEIERLLVQAGVDSSAPVGWVARNRAASVAVFAGLVRHGRMGVPLRPDLAPAAFFGYHGRAQAHSGTRGRTAAFTALRRAESRGRRRGADAPENLARAVVQALQPRGWLVRSDAGLVSGAANGAVRALRCGGLGRRNSALPPQVRQPGADDDQDDHGSRNTARSAEVL